MTVEDSADNALHQDQDQVQPVPCSSFNERRTSMRFPREPGMDFCTVVGPGETSSKVELVDESLGGFGLLVDDDTDWAVGDVLTVEYASELIRCTVLHVTPRPDGRFLLGVSSSA